MRVIWAVLLLLLHSPAWAQDAQKLMGNWRLVSFQSEDVNTKQRNDVFGPHPTGSIGFTPGRFYALIIAENRKAPQTPEEQATAFRTVLAYTGKWRLEEGKFITTVDAAWDPAWVGTDQVRFWKVEGNKLFITSAPFPNPNVAGAMVIGTLVWEREQ